MRYQHQRKPGKDEIVLFRGDGRNLEKSAHWRRQVFDKLKAYLTNKGLKPTHQRNAILEYLLAARVHLTLEDIFAALKKKDPTLGKTTVFRTLKLLENAGIVDRVMEAEGRPHFEVKANRPHHDHAICIDCGAIHEFHSENMERRQNEAVAKLGFAPLWHRHEVFGRCRFCAAKA